MPENPVDAANLLGRDFCSQLSNESEFIITGRGGIVPNATEPFTDEAVVLEWWDVTPETGANQVRVNSEARDIQPPNNQPNNQPNNRQIVEAQGWTIGSNGEIILTANPQNVTPTNVLTPVNCGSENK